MNLPDLLASQRLYLKDLRSRSGSEVNAMELVNAYATIADQVGPRRLNLF